MTWAGPSDAALPSDPAGLPFVTFAHARAQGDYALACQQIADVALRRGILPTPGAGRKACAALLSAQDLDLDAEHRRSLATTRVVSVRVTPGHARVTVQTTLYGITPRATGAAVVEHGQWRIAELPSDAHVGRSYVRDVTNSSMEPTLHVGDTVLVDHAAYESASPRMGDLIVFHPPAGADGIGRCGKRPPAGQACAVATPRNLKTNFLKRIVARPGDRLSLRRGRLTRNGQRVVENFSRPCRTEDPGCTFPRSLTVPAGHYYVLGDNRAFSSDSRVWGPVTRSAIIGRVTRLGP